MSSGFSFQHAVGSAPPRENDGFDLLLPGDYHAKLESMEEKPTKAGTGIYLNCKWRVMASATNPEMNRVVFNRVNVVNPSAQAQAIGLRHLDEICAAVGHQGHLTHPDQVLGKIVVITVGIEKDSTGGRLGDANNVKMVKPFRPDLGSTGAVQPRSPAPVTPAAAAPLTPVQQAADAVAQQAATPAPRVATQPRTLPNATDLAAQTGQPAPVAAPAPAPANARPWGAARR